MSNDIVLTAADGYRLAATVYPSTSDQWITLGSATAVPRWFYGRFAQFAQSHGINVITTDYRGIGGSKPARLRGFMPDYSDWSRLDLAAAVDYASQRGPTWLVGHSLAGHAIGQLPDPAKLKAAYVCAGGAGWHGYMPRSEQFKVKLLWNVIGPIATRTLGYQPMSKFGLGEDIPVSIYRQWKHWCQFPHYFFDDPQAKHITEKFARVTIPIAAVNAIDDWWALPTSRDAFFKGYTNAQVEPITLDPQAMGLKDIGHMGYYRAQVGAVLWPKILHWLSTKGMTLTAPSIPG
jgi:predicted alpha/beta hydrolase